MYYVSGRRPVRVPPPKAQGLTRAHLAHPDPRPTINPFHHPRDKCLVRRFLPGRHVRQTRSGSRSFRRAPDRGRRNHHTPSSVPVPTWSTNSNTITGNSNHQHHHRGMRGHSRANARRHGRATILHGGTGRDGTAGFAQMGRFMPASCESCHPPAMGRG